MDVKEFRNLKPEYKNIEDDKLLDAMTEYVLEQQQASELIKTIKPIWKTHTLRWLYYRLIPNWAVGNLSTDKYTSNKRCMKCKKGVNLRFGFLMMQKDGIQKYTSYCPHCTEEYKEEPNINFSYKLYKIGKRISTIFWLVLDRLHLVRSSISSRYDIFGDESRYVQSWEICETKKNVILKQRKWWEYILIEKPIHNFFK